MIIDEIAQKNGYQILGHERLASRPEKSPTMAISGYLTDSAAASPETTRYPPGSIVVPESVADPLGYYLNNTVKSRALMACADFPSQIHMSGSRG